MKTRWAQIEFVLTHLKHCFSFGGAVFFVLVALLGIIHCAAQETIERDRVDVLLDSNQWTSLDGASVSPGWSFHGSQIRLSQRDPQNREIPGGHIITKNEYEDFEIEFEWKIEKNGNSGIKYMVQRYGDRYLGIEYQIYDDEGDHKVEPRNSTASLYDLVAPADDKPLRPAGEWNRSRIAVAGRTIQHWLNDKLVANVTMDGEDWNERLAASKFNDVPGFCKSRRGRLMLTDHGSDAWYRILRFRVGPALVNP